MTIVYIGLGSNLSDPALQIRKAIEQIKKFPECTIEKISSLYFSRPMGPQDQPDYMNAVLSINTTLSPIDLLDQLQSIENNAGRVRKDNRWGARILDLDILIYGEQVIESERLTVPHYGMKLREFVLIPLNEIAPNLQLPCKENICDLAKKISSNGLKIHSKLD